MTASNNYKNSALNNITVVLCNTSHNGNIGAVARAMKTMGLYKLALVAPQIMPDDHSYALASNARDVVENALITDSLDEVLEHTTLQYALTARKREFNNFLSTPFECAPEILSSISNAEKIAIVFGSERSGLTIEQLEKCNRMVTIPANPEYSSLNLAQAVQVIAYEICRQFSGSIEHLKTETIHKSTFADNQGILSHVDKSLYNAGYYNNNNKNRDMVQRRLQNIIKKANLTREEVDLIRGLLPKLL
ncbi:MAG: tRNA/rRNA methyltransferase [Pseudomonadota bacterium]|nr:tRNA/rRNA methyltransferase [Pseudomonadota bacterium]